MPDGGNKEFADNGKERREHFFIVKNKCSHSVKYVDVAVKSMRPRYFTGVYNFIFFKKVIPSFTIFWYDKGV